MLRIADRSPPPPSQKGLSCSFAKSFCSGGSRDRYGAPKIFRYRAVGRGNHAAGVWARDAKTDSGLVVRWHPDSYDRHRREQSCATGSPLARRPGRRYRGGCRGRRSRIRPLLLKLGAGGRGTGATGALGQSGLRPPSSLSWPQGRRTSGALCSGCLPQGPGVQVVANAPVPKRCRLPPPVVLRWEPGKPGGGLIEGSNHKTYSVSEFEKLHPAIDVAKLPGPRCQYRPFAAPWTPRQSRESHHACQSVARRAHGYRHPQLALLELQRDRGEPVLSMWYTLARDGGPPALGTIRQLVRDASPSTRASVAVCVAQPVATRPSEQPPSGAALFKSHVLGLLAERELELSPTTLTSRPP